MTDVTTPSGPHQQLPQPPPQPKFITSLGNNQTGTIIYGIAEFLRAYPLARVATAVVAITVGLFSVGGLIKPSWFGSFGFFGLWVVFPSLMYVIVISGKDFALKFRDQEAVAQRQEAERVFEKSNSPEDALKLDLSRLNEYYAINQTQARSSFRWAIFSMLLGFITIITGIWVFYFRAAVPNMFMAFFTSAAGTVGNLVSLFFLRLQSSTQQQSLLYFEQLSRLQNLSVAIRLVDAHQDLAEKAKARNLVIRELIKATNAA